MDRKIEDADQAAAIIRAQRQLGLQGGLLIVNPIPEADELPRAEVEGWIETALAEARRDGVTGKRETPYLLRRLAELSEGRTVAANRALAIHNADVAARIAVALA